MNFSNLANLKDIVHEGAFRIAANTTINPYVLGAWVRMCQLDGNRNSISTKFDKLQVDKLIDEMKGIMVDSQANIQLELRRVMEKYGINFLTMVPTKRRKEERIYSRAIN